MYRSPAVEPYVDYGQIRDKENKELTVKQSAMTPPFGTVPYYGTDVQKVNMMLPYKRLASSAASVSHGLYAKDGWRISTSENVNEEYELSAQDRNPIVLTVGNKDAIFDKGKKLYTSMCAHCHGSKGNGEGPMVESGAYAGVPDYKNLKELADGQVFYSIYYGKGAMGAHAMILDKQEMWTLVHYVNKFRFDDYGNNLGAENLVEEIEVPSDNGDIEDSSDNQQ
jgi:cytochrome c553